MLQKAEKKLKQALNQINKSLIEPNKKLEKLKNQRDDEILHILHNKILLTYINEIDGIGKKLGEELKEKVFKNRLSDLKDAFSIINGIGDAKQDHINAWVDIWEEQIPVLLKKDYEWKKAIIEKYSEPILKTQKQIETISNKQKEVQTNHNNAKHYIEKLEKITATNFIQCIQAGANYNQEIMEYINGLFPEWEKIPKWFKDIIAE